MKRNHLHLPYPAPVQAAPAKRNGWLKILASTAFLSPLLCAPHFARADGPGDPHYPDLQPYPAYELRVDSRHKLLQFSVAIANLGEGPMELYPENDLENGITHAYQRLYTHDESGNWSVWGTRPVGAFAFHPEHHHWHFENFASYELRNVAPDGSPGSTILGRGSKVSFCLTDTWRANSHLEHTGSRTYTDCSQDGVQGISVGWADIYPWYLAGQSLDISGLPDGIYWLVVTADPDNLLDEGEDGVEMESNNVSARKFQLSKRKRIKILQ